MQQNSMPYEPALAAPASPYRSTPYEVVHPPMPGAYSQGIPGVSRVVTESGGNSRVQLTIVGAQVGAVLGRNGTNISQIRQVSLLGLAAVSAPHAALHKFLGWTLTRHYVVSPFRVVVHMSRLALGSCWKYANHKSSGITQSEYH